MGSQSTLVLSLRDQPRELGATRVHTLDWVVPDGWKSEVLQAPPGTVVPLNVTVTSVDEGVYVEVTGQLELRGLCVRCLDPVTVPAQIEVSEVYAEASRGSRSSKRVEGDIEIEGDALDPELLIERDTIDLEPVLRDSIFADAPFQPVCDRSCEGLCEHCGIRLADAGPDHHHEFLDPRFAALQVLLDREPEGDGGDDE